MIILNKKKGPPDVGQNSFKGFINDYQNETKVIQKGFKHLLLGKDEMAK